MKLNKKSQSNLERASLPPLTAQNNYATKAPIVTMWCPTFTPKTSLPFSQSPSPIKYTHPSTDPTYHPKRHPDPISCFPTIHLDRQTDTWVWWQLCTKSRLRLTVSDVANNSRPWWVGGLSAWLFARYWLAACHHLLCPANNQLTNLHVHIQTEHWLQWQNAFIISVHTVAVFNAWWPKIFSWLLDGDTLVISVTDTIDTIDATTTHHSSRLTKIQNGSPFRCWLTQVVLEKKSLNRYYVLTVCSSLNFPNV